MTPAHPKKKRDVPTRGFQKQKFRREQVNRIKKEQDISEIELNGNSIRDGNRLVHS